ncbi:MAG: hypothetical protein H7X77_02730 [Anaerolineae bacterium]|nr:hypothetical protein [Anaerolineae bacterium]
MDQINVACEYEVLPGNIHYFKWRQADQTAIEEFASNYEKALTAETSRDQMLILLDFRLLDRQPSIARLFGHLRQMFNRIHQRPASIRAAYLFYQEWGLVTIVKTFLGLLRLNANRRFYHDARPDDDSVLHNALAWLREDHAEDDSTPTHMKKIKRD